MTLNARFKVFLAAFLFLIIVRHGYCTDTLQIKKLELTAKVWGFVVFKTEQRISNPDKELLKFIRFTDKKESYEIYRHRLYQWARRRLSVTKNNCNCNEGILPPSMLWVSDTLLLGNDLSKYLTPFTHICSTKGCPQYYFKKAIPVFYQEIKSNPNKTNRHYMLLGAIKYWNITNYFYSYLTDCATDWNKELSEFLYRFDTLQSYKGYYMALLQFSQKLHDGHARIYSTWAADHLFTYEIPCEVEVYDNLAIVTKIDSSSSLQKNDIITSVNHQPIQKCISHWEKYLSSSTHGWFLHTMRNYLFTSNDSIMNLDIVRNGMSLNMDILLVKRRKNKKIETDNVYNMNRDSIGYIHLENLQLYHIAQMKQQLQSAKVLIVDAREYPNSTLEALSPWLIDEHKVFAYHSTYNTSCLGSYLKDSSITATNKPDRYRGTILFVIDRSTISQGEFMSMAFLQSTNVILMGRSTAGAIGVTSQFNLPGDITCRITTSRISLPDGSAVQQQGISPNVNLSENKEIVTSDDLIVYAYEYAHRIINFRPK